MGNSDSDNKEEDSDSLFSHRHFSKPVWVRYFGVQADTINQRLLEYNVRSIWVGVPIVIFVLLFL
jgi:hypothetical protein